MSADALHAELRFRAMGSHVRLLVDPASSATLGSLRAQVDDLERRWSRFIRGSEIDQLRSAAPHPCVVSAPTAELLVRAQAAHHSTGGLYDPCLAGAVDDAGYREFSGDLTAVQTDRVASIADASISMDHTGEGGIVQLAAGCPLDLGGIGKGFAADLVAATAIDLGADWVVVDIGGDLRIRCDGPRPTEVAIAPSPGHPGSGTTLVVVDGGVATSGVSRRRWSGGHHVIDPRTRRSAITDVERVTVLAAETWWAEACATAAVVAGLADGSRMLEALGLPARFVGVQGNVHTSCDWPGAATPALAGGSR